MKGKGGLDGHGLSIDARPFHRCILSAASKLSGEHQLVNPFHLSSWERFHQLAVAPAYVKAGPWCTI